MKDGLEIKELWFYNWNGNLCVKPEKGQRIVTLNEFHGDYDLDWAVVMEGQTEIKRFNILYVSLIEWA